MLRGRVRRAHFILAGRFRRIRRTITGNMYTAQVERECIEKRRCRSEVFHRTDMDCTMYMATYLSGLRIVGIVITAERRRTVVRGPVAAIATVACCAAVPGISNRGTCARRIAAGMRRATGSALADSELPGRLPHESLPLYIGVPRGEAPWSQFCSLYIGDCDVETSIRSN